MDFLRKLARKINGNPISRNLVLAACAIIVFMCVVNLLLNLFTRHGQVRDVPDFSGMTVEEAVRTANRAAGVVVGKLGTATVSYEELF